MAVIFMILGTAMFFTGMFYFTKPFWEKKTDVKKKQPDNSPWILIPNGSNPKPGDKVYIVKDEFYREYTISAVMGTLLANQIKVQDFTQKDVDLDGVFLDEGLAIAYVLDKVNFAIKQLTNTSERLSTKLKKGL